MSKKRVQGNLMYPKLTPLALGYFDVYLCAKQYLPRKSVKREVMIASRSLIELNIYIYILYIHNILYTFMTYSFYKVIQELLSYIAMHIII